MAAPEKVKPLAREPWAEELRPILARAATGKRAAKWMDGIVGAIERGNAVLFVARSEEGAPLALLVMAFQKWPLAVAHVLAMAAVPRSGIQWGRSGLAAIRDLARRAGAEELSAEALDEANRRRLGLLGFVARSHVMVCPC